MTATVPYYCPKCDLGFCEDHLRCHTTHDDPYVYDNREELIAFAKEYSGVFNIIPCCVCAGIWRCD